MPDVIRREIMRNELLEYRSIARSEQQATTSTILHELSVAGEDCLAKSVLPRHLTASCFVFDESTESTLLSFHSKGRFWVQFGGHIESDDLSLQSAALRELGEESGVWSDVMISRQPLDTDIHELTSAFGACRTHLDVGFVALVQREVETHISAESVQLGWWPVSHPPLGAVRGLWDRVERAVGQVRRFGPGGFTMR